MADDTIEHALPLAIQTVQHLRSSTSPTLSDVDTMRAWEVDFLLSTHHNFLFDSIADHTLQTTAFRIAPSASTDTAQRTQQVRECQTSLLASLHNMQVAVRQALAERIEASPVKPRLYRLAAQVNITGAELRALVFILLTSAGFDHVAAKVPHRDHHGRNMTMSRCRTFAEMDGRQMLEFLSPNRAHFKQGILELCDEYAQTYRDSSVSSPREVLKAVYGCKLTLDEQMKLGNSALSRVIAEEGGTTRKLTKSVGEQKDDPKSPAIPSRGEGDEDPLMGHSRDGYGHTTDTSSMRDLLSTLSSKPTHHASDTESSHSDSADTPDENSFDDIGITTGQDSPRMTPLTADEGDGTGESTSDPVSDSSSDDQPDEFTPYKDDMDYLKDGFQVVQEACKVHNIREIDPENRRYSDARRRVEVMQSEAEAKFRKASAILTKRVGLTKKIGRFIPRLELLVDRLRLSHFERMVLLTLVGSKLSQSVRKALRSDPGGSRYDSAVTVGHLLRFHCDGDLRKEVKYRAYFYRNATLIRSGILTASFENSYSPTSDLGEQQCELDHMVLDYVSGLETELNEIMDSARCYSPKVDMTSVILRDDVKTMVLQRAENFEMFRQMRKELGFDDIIRYGKGLTFCFHGKSGTGKTLFANALASYLNKKMLLVNFTSMSSGGSESDPYKIIFREAKIQGAIVFMDECDEMFEKSTGGGRGVVTAALREMEMFDGIMILATNRPQVLDEAMHRRIAMSVLFEPPDAKQRLAIWKRHVPSTLKLADDVDFKTLAIEFELTGGYIKNAMFQALSTAVNRASRQRNESHNENKAKLTEKVDLRSEEIVVSMEDLKLACRMQARGDLKRSELDGKVIPECGLDKLVATEESLKTLRKIVEMEKVRGHLATRWGFKERQTRSNCVLVQGPNGSGKSFVAGCLGYETGRPLQQIAASELHNINREKTWYIEDLFAQAAVAGAIVVVEEAEQLMFEAMNPTLTSSPGLELLFHMRNFDGLVVLCCTTAQVVSDAGWDPCEPVPNRVASLLSHMVWLKIPTRKMRMQLWKQLFPEETPVDNEVFDRLDEIAQKYEFTGARIACCVRRAATSAAMRGNQAALLEERESAKETEKVKMEDVLSACEDEVGVARASKVMSDWVRNLYA